MILRLSPAGETWPAGMLRLLVIGAMLVFLCPPATAQVNPEQKDLPVVTRTVAIRNARIVQAPGRVIERGTVVMHDGLILDVGTDVEIPYDAEILEGDSLTVYAGFIDGLSHAGMPEPPEREDREEPVNAADPPDEVAGMQPQRRARELLDPEAESIAELRKLGFTAAHVVPRGRAFPGTGSIILFSNAGRQGMVLRPDVSLFMQFVGGSGVYPATPMGIMAKMRQLMREAERRRRIEVMYAENPGGMQRPAFDPVHEAFYPVLSHERPVYVLADGDDGAYEVHRALQLRDELGFSLALAGLNQGFDVVGTLQGAGVPLFLTLGLPEPPDKGDSEEPDSTEGPDQEAEAEEEEEEEDEEDSDTTETMTPGEAARIFDSSFRTASYEDVEDETKNLEARQVLERQKYNGTAARFDEAGLRFGFSTIGAEAGDIRKNLKKMIDAGLTEEAALAALTIDAARLLGLDRNLGTIEPGKVANLVITKGSYFDPDNPVRYVFVDGWKYTYEREADK